MAKGEGNFKCTACKHEFKSTCDCGSVGLWNDEGTLRCINCKQGWAFHKCPSCGRGCTVKDLCGSSSNIKWLHVLICALVGIVAFGLFFIPILPSWLSITFFIIGVLGVGSAGLIVWNKIKGQ